MPVKCIKCEEWIELHTTKESPLNNNQLLCSDCYNKDNEVLELIEEAKDIHYDLENDEEYMKGDRRGWKKNLNEIKAKIKSRGYDFKDYL